MTTSFATLWAYEHHKTNRPRDEGYKRALTETLIWGNTTNGHWDDVAWKQKSVGTFGAPHQSKWALGE